MRYLVEICENVPITLYILVVGIFLGMWGFGACFVYCALNGCYDDDLGEDHPSLLG